MGPNVLRGTGINNWDISLYRRIPLREGGEYIQLQLESYDTFNHTQYSAVSESQLVDRIMPRSRSPDGRRRPEIAGDWKHVPPSKLSEPRLAPE
jgi:hypothetical protein